MEDFTTICHAWTNTMDKLSAIFCLLTLGTVLGMAGCHPLKPAPMPQPAATKGVSK